MQGTITHVVLLSSGFYLGLIEINNQDGKITITLFFMKWLTILLITLSTPFVFNLKLYCQVLQKIYNAEKLLSYLHYF